MTLAVQQVDARAIRERYLRVKERAWRAAEAHGRDPASVALVAVSKTFEADAILPLLDEGHAAFGENRVQEALRKWPPLLAQFPAVKLHLIGPLQSNKAHEAVSLFHCIQTVDRDKLAATLASEIASQAQDPKLLVQVNTGLEVQKAGVDPLDVPAFAASLAQKHGLTVAGLMCIPPVDSDPAPHFSALAASGRELGLADLSMGMSGDFEAAIAAGATIIRVGSAIFGGR